MDKDHFDSIVIGAGQAGPSLAVKLAQRGERVALVEANQLGGTCINNGCTPTKTLRKSARVAHLVRRADEFGIATGPFSIDFERAMSRMRQRVDASRTGLERWVKQQGVEVVIARARLVGRNGERFLVAAGDCMIEAPRVFLNTGTRPFVPEIPGLSDVRALDNRSLLELKTLPDHLVVVGGSYIGLEMAQIFRRLGSAVTIVERGRSLAPREDSDISEMIRDICSREGIVVHTETQIDGVSPTANGHLFVSTSAGDVKGSHLLLAVGRVPNTDGLGLDTIGVDVSSRGLIATNERLETSVSGIWALGDINGRGAFTHTSYHDFEIVAENLAGGTRSADDRVMTYAMFTDPPLGHVGIHRYEAQKLANGGRNVLIADHQMKDVSRAKEESELAGHIRIIVDSDSGKILGATILGINGDEIIQSFVNFMAAGGHWRQMRNALPVHPTVTEFMPTILDKLRPLTSS